MKVTYLYNSGFLVELENHILLFDYYQGTIPDLNPSKPLYVFVSHSHYDHYNPTIYNLNHPNITYIIDHEINNKGIKVLPNKHYYVDDLNIHWWHWIGEPDSDNNYQANTFKSEINKIKDLNFDLMMIPLDPRLEDSMHWGMDYILSHVKATYVLPMHFTDSPKKMLESIDNEPLCRYNNIIKIHNEGEIFILGE